MKNSIECLLAIEFAQGVIYYLPDFTIRINGTLWPREFNCANKMIQLYKEETRSEAENAKKNQASQEMQPSKL